MLPRFLTTDAVHERNVAFNLLLVLIWLVTPDPKPKSVADLVYPFSAHPNIWNAGIMVQVCMVPDHVGKTPSNALGLMEKQKFRYFYGLQEKQFRAIYETARRRKE